MRRRARRQAHRLRPRHREDRPRVVSQLRRRVAMSKPPPLRCDRCPTRHGLETELSASPHAKSGCTISADARAINLEVVPKPDESRCPGDSERVARTASASRAPLCISVAAAPAASALVAFVAVTDSCALTLSQSDVRAATNPAVGRNLARRAIPFSPGFPRPERLIGNARPTGRMPAQAAPIDGSAGRAACHRPHRACPRTAPDRTAATVSRSAGRRSLRGGTMSAYSALATASTSQSSGGGQRPSAGIPERSVRGLRRPGVGPIVRAPDEDDPTGFQFGGAPSGVGAQS